MYLIAMCIPLFHCHTRLQQLYNSLSLLHMHAIDKAPLKPFISNCSHREATNLNFVV